MQSRARLPKWEYRRLSFSECRRTNTTLVDAEKLIVRLDGLGMDGWELISFEHNWQHEISGFAIFKRPVPSELADGGTINRE